MKRIALLIASLFSLAFGVRRPPRLMFRDDPEQNRDITGRAFTIRAASVDEPNRSVECVMATEGRVRVFDWSRGIIEEVLVADGGSFPTQMPMLACHARYSLDDVLGSVRGAKRDGTNWVGRLFFAEDEESDKAWKKTRGGHLTDVSIGYQALEYTDIEPGQKTTVGGREYAAGNMPLRITTKWEARECSLVPIGADRNAKVRGEPKPAAQPPANAGREIVMDPLMRTYLESIGLRHDASVEEAKAFAAALGGAQRAIADDITAGKIKDQAGLTARTAPQAPAAPAQPAPAQTPEQIRAEAQRMERDRISAIRAAAGNDIPVAMVDQAINEGVSAERAAAQFLTHLRSSRTPAVQTDVNVGIDRTRAMAELSLAASLVGVGGERHAAAFEQSVNEFDPYTGMRTADAWKQAVAGGRRYASLGAKDFLRQCLQLAGRQYSLSDSAGMLMRAAISGGAVSNIFTTSAFAVMMMAWEEVPDTTVGWVSEADVVNFLTHTEIDFQTDAQLKKHQRGGTAQHSNVSDSGQTFKLARYSKQFVVDEMDVIDDRFGALLSAPAEHGKAARRLRPQLVYSLLNQNATYGGGLLFNNTAITTAGGHANLGNAALDAAGMKAAVNLMALQYILQGKVRIPLNIVPETLIVPAALQWTAKELINSDTIIIAGTAGAVTERGTKNVLANAVKRLVVDDSIGALGTWDPSAEVVRTGSATNYYLASAPGRTVEVSYRRGTGRAPQLRSFILDQGQWGIGWDVNYDIEAHVKDFRGLVKGNA